LAKLREYLRAVSWAETSLFDRHFQALFGGETINQNRQP
jgi:hypothetical protein